MAANSQQPERSRRMRTILDKALSVPMDCREAIVRDEAGSDQRLAEEVFAMLGRAGPSRPEWIGPYRILDQVGEGGMGVVYLAEQKEPMRRRVALKLVKRGMDSKAVLARFEAERRALSMMAHNCIATVLDCGVSDDGQPYFVMEYVKGIPITDYCDQNRLTLRERIELLIKVCSGVQHAHQKGVMHRDLKPGNVLVTVQDGSPIPKIIDFGLAKATDHQLVEETIFTEYGVMIGTPEYMSPEQAGLDSLDVDMRTDVYSLGVLLHELLVGDLPFSRATLRNAGRIEVQRVIREQEPAKPSTRITTLGAVASECAAARRLDVGALQRMLRGELDWIVLKAIEKDRTRRYSTAQALADDLERHLNDEPVSARPPTAAYLLRKLYRRYRAGVLAGLGMLLALGTGLVFALMQWGEAKTARDEAQVARKAAEHDRENEAKQRAEADRQKQLAEDNLRNFHRLRDRVLLDQFSARGRAFTETTADLAAMRDWLREVKAWLDGMQDHGATLSSMRAVAKRSADGTYQLADPEQQFLHDALDHLMTDLRGFRAAGGILTQVEQGERFVASVRERTVVKEAANWSHVADELRAHPDFRLPSLDPQEGLVPLRKDPESGLYEFLFLRSGEAPVLDSDNQWIIGDNTGIVLVLVPGGRALVGSNSEDAADAERPQRKVELMPYFLGKYEVTQGQWVRLSSGRNPSQLAPTNQPNAPTLAHPVEMVTWFAADELLRRHGLRLPSEAQWEHACRAGTETRWFFGDDHANLVRPGTMSCLFNAATPPREDAAHWPGLVDEYEVHAPVGRFPANAWGLHDMHGNVSELTIDNYAPYSKLNELGITFEPGAGVLLAPYSDRVVIRGGSFEKRVEAARSFARKTVDRNAAYFTVGVRVARMVH